jgi:uncharacterized membrane protein YgdD (TMEM256/DUF423 family)
VADGAAVALSFVDGLEACTHRPVSFLVPIGGVAFIAGWLLLGLSAAFAQKQD